MKSLKKEQRDNKIAYYFYHISNSVLKLAMVAALIWVGCIIATSCTPLSTVPFDPSRKQSAEEIELAQIKSLMPAGIEDPYSGMDCVEYVEYQIAYCEATYQCTLRQYRAFRRDRARLKKSSRSQCLYSKEHIQEVFRAMRPYSKRGLIQ